MMAWYVTVKRAIKQRGVFGTIRYAVVRMVRWLLGRSHGRTTIHLPCDLEFDRQYGVDTCAVVSAGKLELPGDLAYHAERYQATPVVLLRELLERLPVAYERFEFVDLGSGKGRALLVAAMFPFTRVTGVERALRLHAVASANIQTFSKAPDRQCKLLKSVCVDAREFRFSKNDLVIFMYNPFDGFIMQQVLDHLSVSLCAVPRDVYLIYVNPVQRPILDQSRFLRIYEEGEDWIIYANDRAFSPSRPAELSRQAEYGPKDH